MTRRWVEGLVVFGLVVALVGGALLYASQRHDSAEVRATQQAVLDNASQLRRASLDLCQAANNVSGEVETVKESLASLVAASLEESKKTNARSPKVIRIFKRQVKRLAVPVPRLRCERKFE